MSTVDAPAAEERLSHGAEPVWLALVAIGFFLGPLKLLGFSWVGYVVPDALALLALAMVIVERVVNHKPLLARSPLTIPIVALASYCLLEVANPAAPFVRSVLGLRSWVLYLLLYFVGLYSLRSVRQVQRLYTLLLALGTLTALYGVYQWYVGPQRFATWSDAYGQYAQVMWAAGPSGRAVFRAFSTFVTPAAFGGSMSLVMLLAFSVVACRTIRPRWRLLAAVSFAIMAVGLAVSGSRGPVAHLLLCAVVGVLFIRATGWRMRLGVLWLSLGGVAVLVVVASVGTAFGARYATMFDPGAFFWKWFYPLLNGLKTASAHPFGLGLGLTAGVPSFFGDPALRDLPLLSVDSGYGSAAAELGFVGLALFAVFAVSLGVRGFLTWSRLASGRARDLFLGPALIAVTYPMVSVIFQPQATLPSAIYVWLLIGMMMRASALQARHDADSVLRSPLHA